MSISELYRHIGVPSTGAPSEKLKPTDKVDSGKATPDFKNVLREELKISGHAEARIKSRSIPWGPEMERRINKGIEAAQLKGSKEVLILADNVAVIANVKSKTVITAMDRDQMKEKIFTNIDSAVLV